ncbi:Itga9p [Dermatophagoides pteronyssinus]|uniref:Itga9p n=2 Tax=Dermatophagoides pteronyssinus TaxID=6956 RepID=A0ABQ8IUR8_DERPT|nr:Itga9p [Dermatophagoides pteronyssinus]
MIIINDLVSILVLTQNIDTTYPIVFERPKSSSSSSLFGHSVLMHNSEQYGPMIIIGAPNATVNQRNSSNNTGIIYHCDWSSSTTDCTMIDLVNQMTINRQNRIETWMVPNGACFLLPDYFKDDDYSRRKPILILPMSKDRPFKETGDYLHAYAMAGFSATISTDQDSIFLGAPGYDDWRGAVAKINLNDFPDTIKIDDGKVKLDSLESLERDVYLGYSITSGNYFQGDQEIIALGIPRNNLTGSVILITRLFGQPITILDGQQMYEYFGHSLLTIDANQDGFDDLLVAAPMYSSWRNNLYDEGRVFFYQSNRVQGFKEPKILSGDSKPMARFGTAMANLGDTNMDGFPDVAIGAPYEDDYRGSVYIYRGSPQGILEKYVQKISAAKHLSSLNLNGFGYSFSSNVDIDDNEYNDLLIGSYLSEKAILLRTRPIISIQASIHLNDDYVDLQQPCEYDNGQILNYNASCVRIKFCFYITSKYENHPIDSALQCSLQLDPIFNRAFILRSISGRSEYLSTNKIDQSFTLIPPEKKYCSDYYIVYFKSFDKLDNLVDSVVFQLNYSLESEVNEHSPLDKQIFHIPILENEQISNISTDLYFKMCNKTARDCLSNFRLEPLFIYDDDVRLNFANNSFQQFLEGKYYNITLFTKVINIGEPAFNAHLILQTNANISLIRIDKKCNEMKTSASKITENQNQTYSCKLNSPLTQDDFIFITFKSFEVKDSELIWFKLNTIASNHIDSTSLHNYQITFQTIKNASFDVQILRPDPIKTYRKFASSDTKFIFLNSLLSFDRHGPSKIESIEMNFIYPESYNENKLIYDLNIDLISIPWECDKPVKISTNGTDRPVFNSTTKSMHLNCANNRIICSMIRCRFGSWPKTLPKIYVTMSGRMDIGNINKKNKRLSLSNITVDINFEAKINDKFIKNKDNEMNKSTSQIRFHLQRIEPKSTTIIPYIVASIIGGLILLLVIGLCLFWLGFFRRNIASAERAQRIDSREIID